MRDQLLTYLETFTEHAGSVEPGSQGGYSVHRVPRWAREQLADPFFDMAEGQPTGVALRFISTSSEIRLTLATAALRFDNQPMATPAVVVHAAGSTRQLELSNPSILTVDPATLALQVTPHPPETLTITIDPGGGTEVTIFLPHNCSVEILTLEANEPLRAAPTDTRPRWVHYGSSISHCWEASSPDRTWPHQVSETLGWQLRNLGLAGNAQLDPAVARVIRDAPADVVTLKIGINLTNADSMRARTFRSAIEGFLDTIREGQPHTPIVVVSAIGCPFQENTPGPAQMVNGQFTSARRDVQGDLGALTLNLTREILAAVVERRQATDPALTYLDGRSLLGTSEAHLLPDGLHPGQAGMDLIARRLPSLLSTLLADTRPELFRLMTRGDADAG